MFQSFVDFVIVNVVLVIGGITQNFSCLSMGWNQIIIDVKKLIHYAYKHFLFSPFSGQTSQEACDVGREMFRGCCINREKHVC